MRETKKYSINPKRNIGDRVMKNDEPYVAIILLNYNGYDDTVDCVESLLVNLYKKFTIIIVDNNSTDGSGKKLKQLYDSNLKIQVILNKENRGFSAGNNVGIKVALNRGYDDVLLLNNDTIVTKDFLKNIIDAQKRYKKLAIYTGKIKYYYNKNLIWFAGGKYSFFKGSTYHIGIMKEDNGEYDSEKNIEFICGCYMYMNREVIHKIGFLPEEYFLYAEDLDYSLNARGNNVDLKYIPSSVIYHKVSASTSKLSNLSQFYTVRNRFHLIRKYHCGFFRISAISFTVLWCLKRIINGKFDAKTIIKAYRCSKTMKNFKGI